MPSRKYRPIVMNRNKRPGRNYSVLKKVLLVTAILAFIEIIILVVFHFKNAPKTATATGERQKEVLRQKPEEKIAITVGGNVKLVPTVMPKIVTQSTPTRPLAKDTLHTTKPVVQKAKPFQPKVLKDSAVINETQPEELETVGKVSDEQMSQILNDVRAEKTASNNAAKCVTVHIVNSRNADNGFKIANYLRKNGFVMSGREVIKGTLKGIHINANGTCIKLTVGDL